MTDLKQQIERFLGGKIETAAQQPVPGLEATSTSGVIYFQDDGASSLADQFHRLTSMVDPPVAKHGGVIATLHTLTTPNGRLFHAVRYRGDLEGWQQQIAQGATLLGTVVGSIRDGSSLDLSDGLAFPLGQCKHAIVESPASRRGGE